MASKIDWIMSFIRCATLMAPSTLKAVEGSDEAAGAAEAVAARSAAGVWAEFMGRAISGKESQREELPAGRRNQALSVEIRRPCDLPIFVAKVTK